MTAPGFSDENVVFPRKGDYGDQREYIHDSLLFFRNVELSASNDSESSEVYYIGKKRDLFSPQNSSLLKDLFESDKRLSHWMQTSSGPLFAAILADNLDMIRFFERNQESILTRRHNKMYAVQLAVIVPSERAIQYFFDHPSVDLSVVNRFGDNLLHLIFLGSGTVSSKLHVTNIFLQDNNFSKVAHLLNAPNIDGESVMDFALRERSKTTPMERIINNFLRRGAVALRQQALLEKFKTEQERKTSAEIERRNEQRRPSDIDTLRALDRRASEETVRILTREREERRKNIRQQVRSTCPRGFSH